LIGSDEVIDTGTIELPRSSTGRRVLLLVADSEHEGRPPGADPFDIRDSMDWLEPHLELDLRRLKADVISAGKAIINEL
jgi:hypothetical protein